MLELRLRGAHFEDIGRQIGISHQAAQKMYWKALRRIPEKDAKAARKEQLERLDRLRVKAFDLLAGSKNKNPEFTIRTILKVEERDARIRGTDAPTKIEQLNLEDPEAEARMDRRVAILGSLPLEQQRELLEMLREAREGKGGVTSGGIDTTDELEK